MPAPAGEHDAPDDRDHEEHRGHLERPHEVGEQALREGLHVPGFHGAERAPRRVRPRHPAVAVHEHENAGEGEHTEHDGRDPLHRMGVVGRLLLIDPEQRDHEE